MEVRTKLDLPDWTGKLPFITVCGTIVCVSVSHAFRLCKHLNRNEKGDFMCVIIYWVKKTVIFSVFLDL